MSRCAPISTNGIIYLKQRTDTSYTGARIDMLAWLDVRVCMVCMVSMVCIEVKCAIV